MYCSECGQPARGKFCCHCGTPLVVPVATAEADVLLATAVIDWEHEVSYERVMNDASVRQTIAAHASQAKRRMSGEQFLALADKLIPQPVSLEGVAALAQPMWAKLGVRCGKQLSSEVRAPLARVLVRALCSLARGGQTLREVTQHQQGCTLTAELPSDLLSMAGTITLRLGRRDESHTVVEASTQIDGQLVDWGKSRRALERLLTDLQQEVALLSAA